MRIVVGKAAAGREGKGRVVVGGLIEVQLQCIKKKTFSIFVRFPSFPFFHFRFPLSDGVPG
jgi:hypothetical protein